MFLKLPNIDTNPKSQHAADKQETATQLHLLHFPKFFLAASQSCSLGMFKVHSLNLQYEISMTEECSISVTNHTMKKHEIVIH